MGEVSPRSGSRLAQTDASAVCGISSFSLVIDFDFLPTAFCYCLSQPAKRAKDTSPRRKPWEKEPRQDFIAPAGAEDRSNRLKRDHACVNNVKLVGSKKEEVLCGSPNRNTVSIRAEGCRDGWGFTGAREGDRTISGRALQGKTKQACF